MRYKLVFVALVLNLALTTCTENETITMDSGDSLFTEMGVPRNGCLEWSDGCNQCAVVDGQGLCTEMMCMEEEYTPPVCLDGNPAHQFELQTH